MGLSRGVRGNVPHVQPGESATDKRVQYAAATVPIDVVPVNDAPVLEEGEDSVITLNSLTVDQADLVPTDDITVTLSASMPNTSLDLPAATADVEISHGGEAWSGDGAYLQLTGPLASVQASLSSVRYGRSPHFDGSDSLFVIAGKSSSTANASSISESSSFAPIGSESLSARDAAMQLQQFGGFRPTVASLEVTFDRRPSDTVPVPQETWPDSGPTGGGTLVTIFGEHFDAFQESVVSFSDCPQVDLAEQ